MKNRYIVSSLLIVLILIVLSTQGLDRNSAFIRLVYADSTNDIMFVNVYQNKSGLGMALVINVSASSGQSAKIEASREIDFEVRVKFNKGNATDQNEARNYTRCNMTISYPTSLYIWNNVALNQSLTVDSDASYWYLWFLGNWTSTLPSAGVTYTCTDVFEGNV